MGRLQGKTVFMCVELIDLFFQKNPNQPMIFLVLVPLPALEKQVHVNLLTKAATW